MNQGKKRKLLVANEPRKEAEVVGRERTREEVEVGVEDRSRGQTYVRAVKI
jgi:hypothetical protein